MLISVIVVAYHTRKEYFRLAIQSVLDQSLERDKFEIILVKDFDSDWDLSISSNNVKIIRTQPENAGEGTQLARAIKSTEGDIICFLEDDDLWSRDKLQRVYELFNQNDQLGYYHNSFSIIDSEGRRSQSSYRSNDRKKAGVTLESVADSRSSFSINRLLNMGAYFNISCINVRKQVLMEHIDTIERLNWALDYEFFLTAADSRFDILASDDNLTRFRIHSQNSSIQVSGSEGNVELINRWLRDWSTIRSSFSVTHHNYLYKLVLFEALDLQLWLLAFKGVSRSPILRTIITEASGLVTPSLLNYIKFWQEALIVTIYIIFPKIGSILWKTMIRRAISP